MKKIMILLGIVVFLISSCSKDDEPEEQTFFVNLSIQHYDGGTIEIADKTNLYLFESLGKNIDKIKSSTSIVYDNAITYTDGTTSKPKYTSPSNNGVNTFKDIPNGKYILWAIYNNYSSFYSSSKEIVVNYDYRGTMEKKTFLHKEISGLMSYQEWDEKW